MITKNLVVKIENLVNHESRPLQSNPAAGMGFDNLVDIDRTHTCFFLTKRLAFVKYGVKLLEK